MSVLPPPPPIAGRRAGERIPAGLGHAVVRPDIDFETYSEAGYVWDAESRRWSGLPGASGNTRGLPLVGAEPYVRHPTFAIIWAAYDLKDGRGARRWYPHMDPPLDLLGYVAQGGELEAWNVGFERWIWELYCVPRLGWPVAREEQWFCAMAKARAFALPGALDNAARVMNATTQKDPEGRELMKLLSMPHQPTKADPRPRVLPVYTEADVNRRINELIVAEALA